VVQAAGVVLVAAGHPDQPGLLPASLPGVIGVIAADRLRPGEIEVNFGEMYAHSASGWPRDLDDLPAGGNLWGNSFACARVSLDIAMKLQAESLQMSAS